jgi:hypothetical protein
MTVTVGVFGVVDVVTVTVGVVGVADVVTVAGAVTGVAGASTLTVGIPTEALTAAAGLQAKQRAPSTATDASGRDPRPPTKTDRTFGHLTGRLPMRVSCQSETIAPARDDSRRLVVPRTRCRLARLQLTSEHSAELFDQPTRDGTTVVMRRASRAKERSVSWLGRGPGHCWPRPGAPELHPKSSRAHASGQQRAADIGKDRPSQDSSSAPQAETAAQMGDPGLEPGTSSLSEKRSNRLS